MKSPAWFGRGAQPPADPLRAALGAASSLYAASAALHRLVRLRGPLRARRLPCAVVSVGSLLVGGTGKTPTAAWLADALHGRGHAVALATRGYRGARRAGVHVLSDGERIVGDPLTVGDEAMLLARHAPGVPVLVGPDRARAGEGAIERFGTQVLVLDDGAQHVALARDFDLFTLDAAYGFGNGRVLPAGPLREGVEVLRRADALLVIDGPLAPEDRALIGDRIPEARWHRGRREATSLVRAATNEPQPLSRLAGARVGALSGIGLPQAFEATLRGLGAEVVARRQFEDHHRYRARDLAGLRAQAPLWLTTEKDANRLPAALVGEAELLVLGIELEVEAESKLLDAIEARIAAPRPAIERG